MESSTPDSESPGSSGARWWAFSTIGRSCHWWFFQWRFNLLLSHWFIWCTCDLAITINNSTPGTPRLILRVRYLTFHCVLPDWRVRSAVRTPASHAGNMGSSPVRATDQQIIPFSEFFFIGYSGNWYYCRNRHWKTGYYSSFCGLLDLSLFYLQQITMVQEFLLIRWVI